MPTAHGLLAGVKVIDLSAYVSGPFAAMMLADLGADVIKVEPPGGDPNRRIGRRSGDNTMLFAATNHAKRSIVLDLKQPDDAAVLHGLIRWADVMVENWRPGVADRLGLDDGAIDALNPKLVHINITGWGTTGPWAHRSAFDGLLQSFSGVAWSAGTRVVPSILRFYLVDKVTGVFAAQSALAGLVRVARTGRGERIDVNMLDASAYFNFPDVFSERVLCDSTDEVDPENAPTTKTLIRAADGYFAIAPVNGAQIRSLCEAMERLDWLAEFKESGSFENLTELMRSKLETVTPTLPVDYWVELLARFDVPVAPVLDLDHHLSHPQVLANQTYAETDHPGFGMHRVVHHPARTRSDVRHAPVRSFPDLDADNIAVRELAAAHGLQPPNTGVAPSESSEPKGNP